MSRRRKEKPLVVTIKFSIKAEEAEEAERIKDQLGIDELAQVSRMCWRKGLGIFKKLAELDSQLVDQEVNPSDSS